MYEPRDRVSHELLAGQIPNRKTLVSRKDTKERVVYRFPLGLEIHISVRGIRFAGTSANFDSELLGELQQILRWAGKIHRSMLADEGIPLQNELDHTLEAKVRQERDGKFRAWWKGNPYAFVTSETKESALRRLRTND